MTAIDGPSNLYDLGGLQAVGGRVVRSNVLFHSEAPLGLALSVHAHGRLVAEPDRDLRAVPSPARPTLPRQMLAVIETYHPNRSTVQLDLHRHDH